MTDSSNDAAGQKEDVELLRELGLHERYALSRYNVGFPVIVSRHIAAPYSKDEKLEQRQAADRTLIAVRHVPGLPTSLSTADTTSSHAQVALAATVDQPLDALEAHLTERISQLLVRAPLLSTHVHGARTQSPRFARRLSPPVSASEYLSVGAATSLSNSELVRDEIGHASARVVEGPLWHVTLLPSPQGDGVTRVVLASNHVVVDGRGTANLFESLLSPTPLDQGRTVEMGLPERSDRILPMAPPLPYLLKVVFNELFLPRLPGFLSRPLLPRASWPTDKPLPYKPYTRERRLAGLSFPAEATAKLKHVANEHGIKTIQPLLQMAAAVASYVVAGREKVLLAAGTPINVREKERDSFCSGNFVSLHEWQCDVESDTQIWRLAKDYAEDISSPAARRAALHVMGMLSHIPDPPTHVATPDSPTGWEAFFNAKKHSARPYRSSFGISNLGLIRLPGARAREVCWAQTPSPYGEALMIDVCCLAPEVGNEEGGERGGIAISLGWRDGCVEGEAFVRAFRSVVELVIAEASETKSMPLEMTMGEVAKAVRDRMDAEA